MEMPKIGDAVLYVPGPGHARDMGADGLPCFHYHYADKGLDGLPHPQGGTIVPDHIIREAPPHIQHDPTGKKVLTLGMRHHPIREGRPRADWPATIKAVHPDGTVDINTDHPNGILKLVHLNLKVVDAAMENKPLHTCYLAEKK